MKKPFLFVTVLLVFLGGLFLLGLVGVVADLVQVCFPRQVCEILVYEIESGPGIDPANYPVNRVIGAINRRINPGRRHARVSDIGDGRIEIQVFGDDPRTARRIERILDIAGTLEFRVLANTKDHPGLIDRALSEDAKTLKDSEGNLLAWWVPVGQGREEEFNYPEIARRTQEIGGKTVTEILVVKDDYDVTGEYLVQVSPGTDHRGERCVHFTLNPVGAKRFGMLTSENLPDQVQDFARRLGIILNGKLYSAPGIQAAIFERGEITGDFTKDEVYEIVDVLNAGALPARIRLVEKKTPENP